MAAEVDIGRRDVIQRVPGELLIKQPWVSEKGHGNVTATQNSSIPLG